jgi:hypothetical protein
VKALADRVAEEPPHADRIPVPALSTCFHSNAALLRDPRTQPLSAQRRLPTELES